MVIVEVTTRFDRGLGESPQYRVEFTSVVFSLMACHEDWADPELVLFRMNTPVALFCEFGWHHTGNCRFEIVQRKVMRYAVLKVFHAVPFQMVTVAPGIPITVMLLDTPSVLFRYPSLATAWHDQLSPTVRLPESRVATRVFELFEMLMVPTNSVRFVPF